MPGNPRISELMKDDLDALESRMSAQFSQFFKGSGDSLPTSADRIGQLFVKTGSSSPGLYVATGTTTPGWKAVSHAS